MIIVRMEIDIIKFLVDSSSDYSPEEIKEKQLELIPIRVTQQDITYGDIVELDRNRFYQLLEASEEFPKTSQPSPQDFLEIFQKAKNHGDSTALLRLKRHPRRTG